MTSSDFQKMKEADRLKAFQILRLEAILNILDSPSLDPVAILSELRKSISDAWKRLNKMEAGWKAAGEPPESEPPWEVEQDQIENLLGLAFVAAQVFITQVVDSCGSLHTVYKETYGHHLLGHNGNRKSVTSRDCDFVNGTRVRTVAAIDGLANYYKHRDEWRKDWEAEARLNPNSRRTIKILSDLGFDENSPWILREAFRLIAGGEFQDRLHFLGEVLEKWKDDLLKEYRKRIKYP